MNMMALRALVGVRRMDRTLRTGSNNGRLSFYESANEGRSNRIAEGGEVRGSSLGDEISKTSLV